MTPPARPPDEARNLPTGHPKVAGSHIATGIADRVKASVRRRTDFLSENARTALTEDVTENVMAYLREAFEL